MDGDFSGHLLTRGAGLSLATVVDNTDPEGRGRLRVHLLPLDVMVWAALIVPSAGLGYGIALLPKVGEVVVVAFLTPEQPFVLGAVWSGAQSEPAKATPADSRYSLTTPKGMTAVFDDTDGPSVAITTPAGNSIKLTDSGGGSCTVTLGATSVQVTSSEIDLTASGAVQVKAASVKVSASEVSVDAAMSSFSGVVKCDTLIANAVVGTSYTPGAGNIW